MAGFKFHVFLSHNSADKPAVEELAVRLRREGIEPWLDKWNLVPGEPWQPAIERALDELRHLRRGHRVGRLRRLAERGDACRHRPPGCGMPGAVPGHPGALAGRGPARAGQAADVPARDDLGRVPPLAR